MEQRSTSQDGLLKFEQEGFFDRQERIYWWAQDVLSQAKVMVVGAGAIGNEVLKNLALLGVGYIFVVDFDEIEPSNLSRTVLFRKEDLGKKKVEVAAQRTAELALAKDFTIDWFHGDAIWELGLGIYNEMDLVLGCLDNVETRFAVNRSCWLTETPWIDAGIKELNGSITPYYPPEAPCYACGTAKYLASERQERYSCFDFKKKQHAAGKVATVQIGAAWVAALQVQEAVKLLHGDQRNVGYKLLFEGQLNEFERIKLPEHPNCPIHPLDSIKSIVPIRLSNQASLKEFLSEVSQPAYGINQPSLDISHEPWQFIEQIGKNDKAIPFNKPHFQIFQEDIIASGAGFDWHKKTASTFSLSQTTQPRLDLSLAEIGVPKGHIVTVKDKLGKAYHFLLNSDVSDLLKNYKNVD